MSKSNKNETKSNSNVKFSLFGLNRKMKRKKKQNFKHKL